ncbi:Mdm1p [Kluyveromyces lactis]|uniref:KLLA0D01958p n=1 Tax=Kluyveromyces lactis (strain ATCC 8585 / CBS 2359 / DSM 70799 / NBRC 1267 / NRRL Y-1140 / WM37) TaxID=284590 RepID=Q6CSD4_KLULA|nr:uncharacterized protein KLLA0_D01958g [Kluyveromyces lactis]CAH00251.1 KLLA0D01958p [Kluyveromyces lactis]|eukprot:XP_453155.1 uncharacterized protein KLLA0_D01958g [Kluyveromyces lactis]
MPSFKWHVLFVVPFFLGWGECLFVLSVASLLSIIWIYLALNEQPRVLPTKPTLRFTGDKPITKTSDDDNFAGQEALFPNNEALSKEIDILLNNIISNFILSWFGSISESDKFPNTVKSVLKEAIIRFSIALSDVDLCELMILRILPLLTKHYTTFYISQESITSSVAIDKPEQNVDLAVAVEFNKQYRIHKDLSLTLSQESLSEDVQNYSRKRAKELLSILVDPKELESPFVRTILREVVACSVLQPLVSRIATPDFWNTKLIDICSQVLKERSQVTELRAVLSKTIEADDENCLDNESLAKSGTIDVTNVHGTDDDYECFLKQLSCLTEVSQLNILKVKLWIDALQIRCVPNEGEVSSKSFQKKHALFNKRIELALNLIYSKLAYLSPNDPQSNQAHDNLEQQLQSFEKFVETVTVQDVLTNVSSLKFFSAFLEPQTDQSGIIALQLWSFIERKRNPLEDISNDEIQIDTSKNGNKHLRELEQQFFSSPISRAHIEELDSNSVKTIIDFLKERDDTPSVTESQFDKSVEARRCMLLLQKSALKILAEKWYPIFKDSDNFYQMLADSDFIKAHNIATQASNTLNNDFPTDTVRVITHGNLGKALDDILNNNDVSTTDAISSLKTPKKSYSNIFGAREKSLFDDELFGDTSVQEDEETSELNSVSFYPYSIANSSLESLNGSSKQENGSYNDTSILNSLNLKEEIGNLVLSIDTLKKQLELLHHLILKAELTNNQTRLILLKKSERTLRRELEYKELLKQQHMVHENANILYGRAKLCIKSYLTDVSLEDGKETVYYLINVQHIFNNQLVTWDIPRRFSEFYRLNSYLKKKYPGVVSYLQNSNGFPERVKMSLKYHVSKTLLYEERRKRLEYYMQELLKIREVCQDEYFRKYLTDVSNTFKVKENLEEDVEDKRRSMVLLKTDNTVGEVTNVSAGRFDDPKSFSDELDFFEDERNFHSGANGSNNTGTLVKPICELFISFFALNQSNTGWLRGRAIIVVLQRLLGSTIEKYIKDVIQRIRSPEKVTLLISKLNSILWVDDIFFKSSSIPQPSARTEGEIIRTSTESQAMLERFMVETCGKVVGTMYASNAGYRLHSMLQNEYLNVSLMLEIMDVMFDEIKRIQSKSPGP